MPSDAPTIAPRPPASVRAHTARIASGAPLLTLGDVAELLNISKRTCERLLSSGKLPAPDVRLSARLLRWRPATLERFVASGGGGR